MLVGLYLSAFMWGKSILVSLSRVCGVVGQLLTSPDSLIPSRIAALITAYKIQTPSANEIASTVTQKIVNLVSSNSMGLIGFPRSVCGPSDINGAGPVVTAPSVPGPGVRIPDKKRERANRLKRAARLRRERAG